MTPALTEDSVVCVKGVTGSIRILERCGLVRKTFQDGTRTWIAADKFGTALFPAGCPEAAQPKVDPYSARALEMRGYRVLTRGRGREDLVYVQGAYVPISEARKNGHLDPASTPTKTN